LLAWGRAPGSGSRYGFSAEGAIHSDAKRRAISTAVLWIEITMPAAHAEDRNMVFPEHRYAVGCYRHEKFKPSHHGASPVED
jgi:hypothetical protein